MDLHTTTTAPTWA